MMIGLPRQTLPPLLAPGGPSLEKNLNFLASWAFSKFHSFLKVFLTFLGVLFDDERPARRRGGGPGAAGASPG